MPEENWNMWLVRNAHGNFFGGYTAINYEPIWMKVMLGAKTYAKEDAMDLARLLSERSDAVVECKAVELVLR